MTPEISARGFVTPEHYTDTDPPDETQVAWCVEWLSSAPRTTRVYKGCSSYGLKHLAEKLNPSRVGGGYCSNGSLLMAARNLGITMECCDYDSPNGWLAISGRWIHQQQTLAWGASLPPPDGIIQSCNNLRHS